MAGNAVCKSHRFTKEATPTGRRQLTFPSVNHAQRCVGRRTASSEAITGRCSIRTTEIRKQVGNWKRSADTNSMALKKQNLMRHCYLAKKWRLELNSRTTDAAKQYICTVRIESENMESRKSVDNSNLFALCSADSVTHLQELGMRDIQG